MIIPLLALAGGALAGCKGKNPYGDLDTSKIPGDSCFGHKRVTEVKDGKEYYYGVRRYNQGEDYEDDEKEWMFINGEPHTDRNGEYPYYMSESLVASKDDFDDVAKVKIHYLNDSEFAMQIIKDGARYDQKYVGVYMAQSSYGNDVLSFYLADEIGDDVDEEWGYGEGKGKDAGAVCYYNFSWLHDFEDYAIDTAVIMIADSRKEDAEPMPKFPGTADEYISMNCEQTDKVFDEDLMFNLGYFFEV